METDDYASRYPIVSRMAKDLLAIQISKVASESAFSTSGRILDPYRSNLATPIVEALVCTQDWETSTIRKLRQSKISILCWMTSLLQGDVYPYGIHTGRCISIWHSHRINAAYDPYSLDSVFQDVQNQYCIQLYIRKELMFRFEALFEEGKCYLISNFSIHENHGNYPLLPHKFKIIFYKDTTVTRIEPFDDNTHGFKLEPFNRLLDSGNHVYSKQDSVDVIGCGRRIGKIVPVLSVVVQGVPRFRVVLRLIDGTGFAPAVFFNHQFVKLSGLTAWQLMEQCETDPEDYFPHELYTVLGKKWLFKIWFDEFNVRGNNHTYRCDAFSDEEILIAHFKRRLGCAKTVVITDNDDNLNGVEETEIYECINFDCKTKNKSIVLKFRISLRARDNTGSITITLWHVHAFNLLLKTAMLFVDRNNKMSVS